MENKFVDHAAHSIQVLRTIYNTKNGADVIIVVGGCEFPVHSAILAPQSDFFRQLLEEDIFTTEEGKRIVILRGPAQQFGMVLEYMYLHQLNLEGMDCDKLIDIMSLAQAYGLAHLKNSLEHHVQEMATFKNIRKLKEVADDTGSEVLKMKFWQILNANEDNVLEYFRGLNGLEVMEILINPNCNFSELHKYKVATALIRADPDAYDGLELEFNLWRVYLQISLETMCEAMQRLSLIEEEEEVEEEDEEELIIRFHVFVPYERPSDHPELKRKREPDDVEDGHTRPPKAPRQA